MILLLTPFCFNEIPEMTKGCCFGHFFSYIRVLPRVHLSQDNKRDHNNVSAASTGIEATYRGALLHMSPTNTLLVTINRITLCLTAMNTISSNMSTLEMHGITVIRISLSEIRITIADTAFIREQIMSFPPLMLWPSRHFVSSITWQLSALPSFICNPSTVQQRYE